MLWAWGFYTAGMSLNPYTPPSANTVDHTFQTPPRPIAIWVMHLMLAAPIYLYTKMFFDLAWLGVSRAFSYSSLPPTDLLWAICYRGLVLTFLLCCVITIHKKMRIGRWLGICLAVGLFIYSQPWELILGTVTEDSKPSLAGVVSGLTIISVYCYWFFAFGFSKKAKRYFGVTQNKPD